MRIVHIITRFIRGGADENTLISCNGQAHHGHEVYLIYGRDSHADIVSRIAPSVTTICLPELQRPISIVRDVRVIMSVRAICARIKPDIVHTHTSKAGIVGRIAAWLSGCRTIIHGVHILPFLSVSRPARFVYTIAERALSSITTAYIDVSEAMMREALNVSMGRTDNHYVIPSGMDVHAFKDARPIGDDEYPELMPGAIKCWSEAKIILMAAVFEQRKRQLEFLDVFKTIAEANPTAVLLLAGDGEQRPEVEQKIIDCGLEDHVKIIGFRSDVPRWMKRADICALSSEREGLPRVIVQYVLAGKPVVATDLPGVDVVVKEGRNGHIVNRVEDMAEPIATLLGDDVRRKAFAQFSASLDLHRWDASHMVAQIRGVYDKYLPKKRRSGRSPAPRLELSHTEHVAQSQD